MKNETSLNHENPPIANKVLLGEVNFKKGDKVKFIEASDEQVKWGGNNDPRRLLKKETIYEIAEVEVHSWHTKIYLVGIKGKFNSVSFDFA